MPTTRAKEAQALHSVAVALESDGDFHDRYKRSVSADDRRQIIRNYAMRLNEENGGRVTDQNFIVVAGERFMGREYLRRYFDQTWDMPKATNEHDDPRARRSKQFPFEFWLDKELHPGQARAGEAPALQPQPGPQPDLQPMEQPIMMKITTKTLLNGKDIAELTNEYLFEAIASAEAEIEKCQAIKTKPKALQAKIVELQEGIVALVGHMDARS